MKTATPLCFLLPLVVLGCLTRPASAQFSCPQVVPVSQPVTGLVNTGSCIPTPGHYLLGAAMVSPPPEIGFARDYSDSPSSGVGVMSLRGGIGISVTASDLDDYLFFCRRDGQDQPHTVPDLGRIISYQLSVESVPGMLPFPSGKEPYIDYFGAKTDSVGENSCIVRFEPGVPVGTYGLRVTAYVDDPAGPGDDGMIEHRVDFAVQVTECSLLVGAPKIETFEYAGVIDPVYTGYNCCDGGGTPRPTDAIVQGQLVAGCPGVVSSAVEVDGLAWALVQYSDLDHLLLACDDDPTCHGGPLGNNNTLLVHSDEVVVAWSAIDITTGMSGGSFLTSTAESAVWKAPDTVGVYQICVTVLSATAGDFAYRDLVGQVIVTEAFDLAYRDPLSGETLTGPELCDAALVPVDHNDDDGNGTVDIADTAMRFSADPDWGMVMMTSTAFIVLEVLENGQPVSVSSPQSRLRLWAYDQGGINPVDKNMLLFGGAFWVQGLSASSSANDLQLIVAHGYSPGGACEVDDYVSIEVLALTVVAIKEVRWAPSVDTFDDVGYYLRPEGIDPATAAKTYIHYPDKSANPGADNNETRLVEFTVEVVPPVELNVWVATIDCDDHCRPNRVTAPLGAAAAKPDFVDDEDEEVDNTGLADAPAAPNERFPHGRLTTGTTIDGASSEPRLVGCAPDGPGGASIGTARFVTSLTPGDNFRVIASLRETMFDNRPVTPVDPWRVDPLFEGNPYAPQTTTDGHVAFQGTSGTDLVVPDGVGQWHTAVSPEIVVRRKVYVVYRTGAAPVDRPPNYVTQASSAAYRDDNRTLRFVRMVTGFEIVGNDEVRLLFQAANRLNAGGVNPFGGSWLKYINPVTENSPFRSHDYSEWVDGGVMPVTDDGDASLLTPAFAPLTLGGVALDGLEFVDFVGQDSQVGGAWLKVRKANAGTALQAATVAGQNTVVTRIVTQAGAAFIEMETTTPWGPQVQQQWPNAAVSVAGLSFVVSSVQQGQGTNPGGTTALLAEVLPLPQPNGSRLFGLPVLLEMDDAGWDGSGGRSINAASTMTLDGMPIRGVDWMLRNTNIVTQWIREADMPYYHALTQWVSERGVGAFDLLPLTGYPGYGVYVDDSYYRGNTRLGSPYRLAAEAMWNPTDRRRWAVALSELPKMVNSQCNDPNGTRYLLGLTNTFIDRAGAVRGQPLARVGYEVVWERAKLAIDGAFLPGPPPFTTPLSVNDLGVSTPTGGNAFWIGDGATEWFMHYVVAHEILHALLGNYENGQVSPWERACYRSRNIHRNPGVGGYAGQAASWDSGAARSIWTGNDYNGPVSLGIGTPFRMAALYERALRRGLVVPSDCSLVER